MAAEGTVGALVTVFGARFSEAKHKRKDVRRVEPQGRKSVGDFRASVIVSC